MESFYRAQTLKVGPIELGRFGDSLPVGSSMELQDAFGFILENSASSVVCGSPYEVANKLELGGEVRRGGFDGVTFYNHTTWFSDLERQRISIWMEIALKGLDQLPTYCVDLVPHLFHCCS